MLVAVAAAQQTEQPMAEGVIYGTVIDQDGQPAKNLGLTAYPLAAGGISGGLPHTKADQSGKFRFTNLPSRGRYNVYAEDEDAGYSHFSTGPNDPKSTKEVTLSPEQPEAEFNLVLPPKAGFLKIRLTNYKTGEPVEAVQVTAMSADDPKTLRFLESCASTRAILIPPDEDLLLHITSWGFNEWTESVGNGKPVRMRSGSRLKWNVALDPSEKTE